MLGMWPMVILAGGLATRLRPLTETIPKALVDVNGAPFVAHLLALLHARGIRRVVICAGYRGEMIREYVEDGSRFGLRVDVVLDGPRLLGTAGAIRNAAPLLGDVFFVQYGDSYLPCDYRAVGEAFVRSGKLALMTVFRNDSQWDDSNVEFSEGALVRYEKGAGDPRMRHIDYGLGVFRREAFGRLVPGQPHDLAQLYRQLLADGQLAAYEVGERFYEAGSFRGLEELRKVLRPAALQGLASGSPSSAGTAQPSPS
jgi:N-acetyl-alpha-D-muramate 1-phosphate uridylyltransferase